MNTLHKLDYVEFGANNLEATQSFFTWSFTDYGPDYTSFERGFGWRIFSV